MKMKEYPQISELSPTDIFILDGPAGTRKIRAADLGRALLEIEDTQEIANFIDMGKLSAASGLTRTDKILVGTSDGNKVMALADFYYQMTTSSNSGDLDCFHGSIFRGKNLGNALPEDLWDRFSSTSGAYRWYDLWLGDYWNIGGNVYRIGDFNYWFNYGDTVNNTSHILIVSDPSSTIGTKPMNDSDTTVGGYFNSKIKKTTIPTEITPIITSAFGEDHLYSHRELFVSAVDDVGMPSSFLWADTQIDIPCQTHVVGYPANSKPNKIIEPAHGAINYFNLAAYYTYAPRRAYWLQDSSSLTSFRMISNHGHCDTNPATGKAACYVRTIFGICA